MADVRLLSSSEDSSRKADFSDDESSKSSLDYEFESVTGDFRISKRRDPLDRAPSTRDRLKLIGANASGYARSHYKWVTLTGLTIVLVIILAAVIPSHQASQIEKPSNTKPKPKPKPKPFTDREIPCTTWNENSIIPAGNASKSTASTSSKNNFVKPSGFKVVAFMFFGRREFVDILDCYLRRNLVSNGGVLDEVHFLPNTRDPADLKWLNNAVESVDEYKRIEIPERCAESLSKWACMWDAVADPNTLYIKVDDDLIYIHDNAIPSLVHTRTTYKEPFAIGGNIVNNRFTANLHWHNNAIHPYLPETDSSSYAAERKVSWRPSELPPFPYPEHGLKNMANPGRVLEMEAPYVGHRWLRLEKDKEVLKTPMAAIEWGNGSLVVNSWAVNTQQQYSLLENIEQDQLDRYRIGDGNGHLNMQYRRYNINLLAIWGADVADNLPFDIRKEIALDERLVSVALPKKLGRPFIVDSNALTSHYSFHAQLRKFDSDVLDRWRAYANDQICLHGPRRPFGPVCPAFKTGLS